MDVFSLGLKADSTDLNKARRALTDLGNEADKTEKKVSAASRRMAQEQKELGRILSRVRDVLAAVATVQSVRALITQADAYQQLTGRLRLVTKDAKELAEVQARLFEISQRTGTAVTSNTELFIKLSTVSGELGASQSQLLKFSEGIGNALTLSGASAQSASGALQQLSQALGGGIVRAEEFNSILEGVPVIVQTVARNLEGAGGSVAGLRKLVIDGRVSSDAFFNAFLAGSSALASDLASLPRTVGRATTELENQFGAILTSADLGPVIEGIDSLKAAISDPDLQKGFADLIKIMVGGSGAVLKLVSGLADVTRALGEYAGEFALSLQGTSGTLEGQLLKANQQLGYLKENIKEARSFHLDTTESQQQVEALEKKVRLLNSALLDQQRTTNQAVLGEVFAGFNTMLSEIANGATHFSTVPQIFRDVTVAAGTAAKALEKAGKATKSATQEAREQIAEMARREELVRSGVNADEASIRAQLEARKVIGPVIDAYIEQERALRNVTDAQEAETKAAQDAVDAEMRRIEQETEAAQRAYERSAGKVEDVFERLFRSSLGGFKSFKKALENGFKDLLTQLALQAAKTRILVPITTAIIGGAPIGAQAGDGGRGGFSLESMAALGSKFAEKARNGLMDAAYSIGDATGSEMAYSFADYLGTPGTMESINSALSTAGDAIAAFGIGKTVGGFLENKGVFGGNTGNYVGAGAAIGSMTPLGPLGAAIGGLGGALVAGIIGNWKTKSQTVGIAITDGIVDATITTIRKKSSLIGSKTKTLTDEASGLDRYLQELFSGVTGVFEDLGLSLNGLTAPLSVSIKGLDDAAAMLAINNAIATAALPNIADYQQANEDLLSTLSRVTGETMAVRDALQSLGGVAQIVSGTVGVEVAQSLAQAAGGFQKLNGSLSFFYENFYSDAERKAESARRLTVEFGKLGQSVPQSVADFRRLVNGIDITSSAGQALYTAVIGLAPTFIEANKAVSGLVSSLRDLRDEAARQAEATRVPGVQLSSLRSQFTLQSSLASVGSTDAAALLPELGKQFLEASRNFSGSQIEYLRDLAAIQIGAERAAGVQSGVPGFAAGGIHAGGLRIVGENGPELEYTGPSRIYSTPDTKAMFSQPELLGEMRALRDEMRAGMFAVAKNTGKTADRLDRWDGDGLPQERTEIA